MTEVDPQLQPREDVVAAWREAGYDVDFEIVSGGRVGTTVADRLYDPEELVVERMHRYEGDSNPGDEVLLVALRAPDTGVRGTLTLAYGAYASADEADVARRLPDARDR